MRARLFILPLLAATTAAAPALNKFSYSYPTQVNAYPALHGWFEGEKARLRSAATAEAAAAKRDAAKDGSDYLPYETSRTWKVVTDTPAFLSLSQALVWDKRAGVRRPTLGFFTSAAALKAAVTPAFCQQLNAERRRKREGDMGDDAEFNACIDPTKEVLILGSSTRAKFNRVGFLIAPYEAGPYAEGDYEVTLPVTPAILAAVRPEYRGYFALGTP
jgi:hypothetical protein